MEGVVCCTGRKGPGGTFVICDISNENKIELTGQEETLHLLGTDSSSFGAAVNVSCVGKRWSVCVHSEGEGTHLNRNSVAH